MERRQIALSIEQMKHLEELGLDTSDASMCWNHIITNPTLCYLDGLNINWKKVKESNSPISPAYTLQDILEKLPCIEIDNEIYVAHISGCTCSYIHCNGSPFNLSVYKSITSDTNLEAAYKMLCWCIENNYVH